MPRPLRVRSSDLIDLRKHFEDRIELVGAMPMPESATVMGTFPTADSAETVIAPFGSENLQALLSRLLNTCASRTGSA